MSACVSSLPLKVALLLFHAEMLLNVRKELHLKARDSIFEVYRSYSKAFFSVQ